MNSHGWFLSTDNLNQFQIGSLARFLEHAKRAHLIDVTIRKDSVETDYDADWIKHLVAVEYPPKQDPFGYWVESHSSKTNKFCIDKAEALEHIRTSPDSWDWYIVPLYK